MVPAQAAVFSNVAGRNISAGECDTFTAIVASFSATPDVDPNVSYSAIIDWGDGTSSAGQVVDVTAQPDTTSSDSGGSSGHDDGDPDPVPPPAPPPTPQFVVVGTHQYLAPGTFAITTTIIPSDGTLNAVAHGSATISKVVLSSDGSTGPNVTGVEGKSLSGTFGRFSDDGCSTPSDYTVNIDWGDGLTSSGTITNFKIATGTASSSLVSLSGSDDDDENNNATPPDFVLVTGRASFSVVGTHVYQEEGTYTIVVTVTKFNGESASVTRTAVISDAPITLTGSASGVNNGREPGRLTGNPGAAASGVVATLRDDNPFGMIGDFSAQIIWGDGTVTGGAITGPSGPSGGPWDISGSHQYKCAGTYVITVTVKDDGGSTASATTVAVVAPPSSPLDMIFDLVSACTP
jgi:hypothetical protein